MGTAFKSDLAGAYVEVDPSSDLDYSVSSWLEGLLFIAPTTWAIVPNVAGALHSDQINANPVVIDGRTYAPGELASVWIKNLVAGQTYEVTVSASFTGNRKDERTFRVVCKQR